MFFKPPIRGTNSATWLTLYTLTQLARHTIWDRATLNVQPLRNTINSRSDIKKTISFVSDLPYHKVYSLYFYHFILKMVYDQL